MDKNNENYGGYRCTLLFMFRMPLFKVWNKSEELKKIVNAEGLDDLLTKGKEKLGILSVDCRVVLQDGTQVEDDEALLYFKNEVIIILENNCDTHLKKGLETQVHVQKSGTAEEQVHVQKSGTAEEDDVLQKETPPPASAKEDSLATGSTEKFETKKQRLPSAHKMELPQFSPNTLMFLKQQDRSLSTLNAVLREAAEYYYFKYPSMDSSPYYQAIGEKLVKKYQCLVHEGARPWSFICDKLSARIRQLRYKENKKTKREIPEDTSTEEEEEKVKRFKIAIAGRNLSDEDFLNNQTKIQDLWDSGVEDGSTRRQMQLLLQHSYSNRQTWTSSKILSDIVEAYPCFQDGLFVCNELYAKRNGGDAIEKVKEQIQDNIDRVAEKAEKHLKKVKIQASTGDPDVDMMLRIEQRCAMTKGKGQKSRSVFIVHEVDSVDVVPNLEGSKAKALVLHLVMCDNKYKYAYVVGEGIIVKHARCIWTSVLTLLGAYYLGDLEYPKVYGQFLGLMQQLYLNDPYTLQKGTGFMTLYQLLKDSVN